MVRIEEAVSPAFPTHLDLRSGGRSDPLEKERVLVVVNTHIHWDPEYPDVKLMQVCMLLEELELILNSNKRLTPHLDSFLLALPFTFTRAQICRCTTDHLRRLQLAAR